DAGADVPRLAARREPGAGRSVGLGIQVGAQGVIAGIPDGAWALLFARLVLGLIFGMAGWGKVFQLTPAGHAHKYFVDPYADTWIPAWLLWTLGLAIPFVELIAGWLVFLGLWTGPALLALGGVLVVVTYG